MSEAIIPPVTTPGAGVLPPNVAIEPVQTQPAQPELVQTRESSLSARVAGWILAAEMSPANEFARYGAFSATLAATGDGVAATAVGAATSLALEVGATFAGAHYYRSAMAPKRIEQAKNILLRSKIGAFIVKAVEKPNKLAESGVALLGGSGVLLGVKHDQNPERTKADDIRTGTIAALGVAAVTAAQTGPVAAGAEAIGTPGLVGAVGMALIGAVAAKQAIDERRSARAERRAGERASLAPDDDTETTHNVAPRYDLSHEELRELESGIVEKAKTAKGIGLPGLTAVWIEGNSEHANFMRTHENEMFPEDHVPDLFADHEESSKFLALVDTRGGRNRVIRGTRFTTPRVAEEGGASKMAMIEGMVESGQVTEEEFTEYYRKRGVDVNECLSIETNFRIGDRVPRALGFIPAASLAYFTAYNYAVRGDRSSRNVAIFAHINQASVNSLEHLGVDTEPLMDDEALWTPDASKKDRDLRFDPVALLNTPRTARTMKRLAAFAPREVRM